MKAPYYTCLALYRDASALNPGMQMRYLQKAYRTGANESACSKFDDPRGAAPESPEGPAAEQISLDPADLLRDNTSVVCRQSCLCNVALGAFVSECHLGGKAWHTHICLLFCPAYLLSN